MFHVKNRCVGRLIFHVKHTRSSIYEWCMGASWRVGVWYWVTRKVCLTVGVGVGFFSLESCRGCRFGLGLRFLVAPGQAPRAAARLARSGFARRPEAGSEIGRAHV